MDILIWIGAGISLLGLLGLMWCILRVFRARREKLSDEEMRKVLSRVLPANMGSLFLSVIGLMVVIVGIWLG